jgi:hypothetical protein
MAKRSKKVRILEEERPCIRPTRTKFTSRANLKAIYGNNVSGYGMCPVDSPYLGYQDGLYCCKSAPPTPDETYMYLTQLIDNIGEHQPDMEQIAHWRIWSGLPETFEQERDIAEVVPARKINRMKDMRWAKAQFEPRGAGSETHAWANSYRNKVSSAASCEVLNRDHCNARRDCRFTDRCTKRSRQEMQAMQKADLQERQLRELRAWSNEVDQDIADEEALLALLEEERRQQQQERQRRQCKQTQQYQQDQQYQQPQQWHELQQWQEYQQRR